jgi:hypothetical protein
MALARSSAPGEFIEASNSPLERTAGPHALAAAGHRERSPALGGEAESLFYAQERE